jgi:hypothetical protein
VDAGRWAWFYITPRTKSPGSAAPRGLSEASQPTTAADSTQGRNGVAWVQSQTQRAASETKKSGREQKRCIADVTFLDHSISLFDALDASFAGSLLQFTSEIDDENGRGFRNLRTQLHEMKYDRGICRAIALPRVIVKYYLRTVV